MTQLQPLEPKEAVRMYLSERSNEAAEATLQSHKSRLSHFTRWTDQQGIDNLNGLSGRDMHRYKLWRRDDGNLKATTVKTQLDTLRVFIRFCQRIDAVEVGVADAVQSPTLSDGQNQRDVHLDAEAASDLLEHLNRFQYASFEHVLMTLLWHTGLRTGGVRSIDLRDFDASKARITLRHRPDTDTPLKNGEDGNRLVALGSFESAEFAG